MKNTWYLGIFVFALALMGVSLDKSTNANQEIVLKFTESEVTSGQTEEVIRFVKSQLETIAVGEIQIKKSDYGTLKITYYSEVATAQIKKLLSSQSKLVLSDVVRNGENQFPEPDTDDFEGYQLDVFEIQTSKDFAGASGTIVEFKTESIRFYTPDVYTFSEQLIKEETANIKRTFLINTTITLAIVDNFCTVPQVRAGPVVG